MDSYTELLEKGASFFERGQFYKAIHAYNQAIKLVPNSAIAYERKGSALQRLGLHHEASQAFDQFRRINTSAREAAKEYWNKAKILRIPGQQLESQDILPDARIDLDVLSR